MAIGKLVLKDVDPYSGSYEIPAGGWTNRELHYIRQHSGVRAGEINEALKAGDAGVLVAMAAVLLQRNGFPEVNIDALWDMSDDNWDFEKTGEDEDRPPESATTGGEKNSSAVVAEPNDPTEPSGTTGTDIGASSQPTPLATGALGSGDSADFAQPI